MSDAVHVVALRPAQFGTHVAIEHQPVRRALLQVDKQARLVLFNSDFRASLTVTTI
jgi:hypothetical protein